jgi:glucose-6-phosphate isomerase
MFLTYFDSDQVSPQKIKRYVGKLKPYRQQIERIISKQQPSKPEYSLIHAANPRLHTTLDVVRKKFKAVEHVVVVGIGGSNLGTEAIHDCLDVGKVKFSQLDTIAANEVQKLVKELKRYKSVKKIAICIISKSGGTTETITNAGVLLKELETKFKQAIYKQTICIGNANTAFMRRSKRLGAHTITMPDSVGGRYSVATEVGLVPITLLGHDVDAFIAGVVDAGAEEFESLVAESAARIYAYQRAGYVHYNFFAFEKRLYTLGAWYRQLFAESLGKAKNKKKQSIKSGMLPTISTPVELHSVGQLYLSGFPGVYTDFVTFDDDTIDFEIPSRGFSSQYGRFTVQEVATALYGGVIGAYQEAQLPYRSTIFEHDSRAYSLGLFMAMRMREVMYLAALSGVDAFDQPNVELYKNKTRAILKL